MSRPQTIQISLPAGDPRGVRVDAPVPSMDALWAREADDRLAAYHRNEIRAVALSEMLAKYRVSGRA